MSHTASPSPQDTVLAPQGPPPQDGPPPQSYRGVRRLGAVVAGLVVLGTAASILPEMITERGEDRLEIPATVDRLVVDTGVGDITVRPLGEGDEPVANARTSAWVSTPSPAATVTTAPDGQVVVTLADSCEGWAPLGRCTVEWDVALPEGVDIEASTEVGDLDITGQGSEVDLATDVGDINLEGQVSRAGVATRVSDVRIDLDTPPDLVEVTLNLGDAQLTLPEGEYDVDARTNLGDTHVEVADTDDAASTIRVSSDLGDIAVHH